MRAGVLRRLVTCIDGEFPNNGSPRGDSPILDPELYPAGGAAVVQRARHPWTSKPEDSGTAASGRICRNDAQFDLV